MIWIVIYLMFVHWFSDFVLQTRHMANRKSESNYYLTMHVIFYTVSTIFFWMIGFLLFNIEYTFFTMFLAFLITFVTHWVTDYITSRINSRLYKNEKIKSFFTMIGFDQWIHTVTLLLTYQYVIL
jgi:hypothetical protein